MGSSRSSLVIFIVLFCVHLFFQGSVVKGEPFILNYSVSPSLVWVDGSVDIRLQCYSNSSNETLKAWLELKNPISKKIELVKSAGEFKASYSTFPYLGEYSGVLVCSDNVSSVTEEVGFVVRDLRVSIVGIEPQTIYPDSSLKVFLKVKEVGDGEEEIKEGVKFKVFVDGSRIFADYFFDNVNGRWVVLPQKLKEGEHRVEVEVDYQDVKRKAFTQIRVNPVLSLLVTSVTHEVLPNQELTIGLRASYRGNSTSLKLLTLTPEIDGEEIKILRVGDSSLTILLPEKPPGEHELKITATYKGYDATISFSLEYVLPVTGNLVDAEGRSVSGILTFSKPGYSKHITVNGPYSGYVPKGVYDVEFSSPEFKIVLTNVKVESEWEDWLKIDIFGKDVKVPGLKVAGGAAIEFAHDFEKANIEIGYDSRVILNELLIKVYACENWNFKARKCVAGWKEVEAEVDTIRDVVKFSVTHLSAFVVGEMSRLKVIFTTDKDRYFLNEPINVKGIVRDDRGRPVEDANVTYEFDGIKGNTFTDKDGIFTFSIISPAKEGEFTITLEATKTNYLPDTSSKKISVVARKDLAIIFGVQQTIEAGKNQTLHIKIMNSGQTDLHNLRIRISGLPEDWFDFHPEKKSILGVGEEVDVKLKINAPRELEPKTYVVKVDVVTDEIEKSDSFVLILQPPPSLISEKMKKGKPQPLTGFFSFLIAQISKVKWLVLLSVGVVGGVILLSKTRGKKGILEKRKKMIRRYGSWR